MYKKEIGQYFEHFISSLVISDNIINNSNWFHPFFFLDEISCDKTIKDIIEVIDSILTNKEKINVNIVIRFGEKTNYYSFFDKEWLPVTKSMYCQRENIPYEKDVFSQL